MNLPPIPEPRRCDVSMGTHRGELVYYSADQLREYGESCARMAREEAAKLVEGMWEIDGDHTARLFAAAIRKG